MKRFIIIIICLLLLTSCWNRREFNELAITYGIGIDRINGEYSVTAQAINPEQFAGENSTRNRSPVVVFEAKEKTILNAIRKLSQTASRKIYASHLYALIISEDVAKQGLSDVLDLFYRDQELRTDFYVFIAKDSTAKEILSTLTPFSVAPAQELYDRIRYSDQHWDPTKATSIRELITKTITDGVHPTVPSILSNETETNSNNQGNKVPEPPLPTGNLAVFYNDKLHGWLNEEQARTYNIVINNITNSVTNFPCPKKGYGVLESTNVKTKMTPTIKKEKPKMDLKITFQGEIAELDCDQETMTTDAFKKLEKEIEKYLEGFFSENIKEIQEDLAVDIFGFGREFYRKKPKNWRKLKKDWDKNFETLDIDVKVNVNIDYSGTIEDSLKNKVRK